MRPIKPRNAPPAEVGPLPSQAGVEPAVVTGELPPRGQTPPATVSLRRGLEPGVRTPSGQQLAVRVPPPPPIDVTAISYAENALGLLNQVALPTIGPLSPAVAAQFVNVLTAVWDYPDDLETPELDGLARHVEASVRQFYALHGEALLDTRGRHQLNRALLAIGDTYPQTDVDAHPLGRLVEQMQLSLFPPDAIALSDVSKHVVMRALQVAAPRSYIVVCESREHLAVAVIYRKDGKLVQVPFTYFQQSVEDLVPEVRGWTQLSLAAVTRLSSAVSRMPAASGSAADQRKLLDEATFGRALLAPLTTSHFAGLWQLEDFRVPNGAIPSFYKAAALTQEASQELQTLGMVVEEGCFARAHITAQHLRQAGYNAYKLFVRPHDEHQSLQPRGFDVCWEQHVAAFLVAQQPDGQFQGFVVDPLFSASAPLTVPAWLALFTGAGQRVDAELAPSEQFDIPSRRGVSEDSFVEGLERSYRSLQRLSLVGPGTF